ncbi:MAG: DUF177 domain-containing protein [Candidatus Aminicenantales bacterium]
MIIHVDQLPKDGLKISRDYNYGSMELVEEEVVFLEPVHAEVTVKKIGQEISVKGRIESCFSFVCSRCLTPFNFTVDSKFDLIFLPEERDVLKEELDDEDINNLFYGHHINIREIILEQLNLTFPMKPLCSDKCEGICAVCGKIRRSGNCGCLVKESDSRMDTLKIFMKDKS